MDRFELTYFYGPEDDYIVKEETVEAIARAGFTLAPLDSPDPQVNKRALRLFQKHGLRAMVRDRRLSHLICCWGTLSTITGNLTTSRGGCSRTSRRPIISRGWPS